MEFEFIAGNLALDFVGTVTERATTRLERLRAGADLAGWIVGARILDDPPPVDRRTLEEARRLREALHALSRAYSGHGTLAGDDVSLVNAYATRPPPALIIGEGGRLRREGTVMAALAAIARDGAELAEPSVAELIGWCADATCTRPFLDRSRGRRRRWCGMTGCGDRAKAAAYRERRRLTA